MATQTKTSQVGARTLAFFLLSYSVPQCPCRWMCWVELVRWVLFFVLTLGGGAELVPPPVGVRASAMMRASLAVRPCASECVCMRPALPPPPSLALEVKVASKWPRSYSSAVARPYLQRQARATMPSRAYDHLYDSTYLVSGARDHNRTVMAGVYARTVRLLCSEHTSSINVP